LIAEPLRGHPESATKTRSSRARHVRSGTRAWTLIVGVIAHHPGAGDLLQVSPQVRNRSKVYYLGCDSIRYRQRYGRCTAPRWVDDRLAAPALGLGRGLHALSAPRERLHRPSALVPQHFDTIKGVIVSTLADFGGLPPVICWESEVIPGAKRSAAASSVQRIHRQQNPSKSRKFARE